MALHRRAATALVTAVLLSAACGSTQAQPGSAAPAEIQAIPGSEAKEIRLTQQAADRLGVESSVVVSTPAGTAVVPFKAIFYTADGQPWVYTSPERLAFRRVKVAVRSIADGRAVLAPTLSAGTLVVVVGVPELYGAETGVGE